MGLRLETLSGAGSILTLSPAQGRKKPQLFGHRQAWSIAGLVLLGAGRGEPFWTELSAEDAELLSQLERRHAPVTLGQNGTLPGSKTLSSSSVLQACVALSGGRGLLDTRGALLMCAAQWPEQAPSSAEIRAVVKLRPRKNQAELREQLLSWNGIDDWQRRQRR